VYDIVVIKAQKAQEKAQKKPNFKKAVSRQLPISLIANLTVNWVKCICCYIVLGSNGCFVISAALTGNHYKTYNISGVGHPRSDSIVPLVLWIVAYNI
jgi:hypothetical protein